MFKRKFGYLSPGGYVVSRSWSTWVVLLACLLALGSCARKSGCPVNDPAQFKTDKKGDYKGGKGSSNLFPKDMRRRTSRN